MVGSSSPLAVITGRHAPGLSDDGRRLLAALGDRGVEADPVRWDDPTVDWSRFGAVLFRSCWDYPEDIDRFEALLGELERAPATVANPLPAVRWNRHKRYLEALAGRGVRTPPTVTVERGADRSLIDVLRERGWDDAVVKPGIGAMSSNVWRTSVARAPYHQSRFEALLAEQDVLVQAFVPEVLEGERSAVFFAGRYSHAWNSLPAEGDVTSFDGIDPDYEPTGPVMQEVEVAVAAARSAIGLEPAALPYARVDYVPRGSEAIVLEVELIEPFLGLDRDGGALERFVDALLTYFDRAGASEVT